jgi:hypothetical protein
VGLSNLAFNFRESGILSDFGSIRTYGYPLFLYLLSFLTGINHDRLAVAAGATQYLLFFASAVWLSRLVAPYGRSFALAVRIGLLLNPFVALITDALSDGLSFLLMVLLVDLAVCADRTLRNIRQTVFFLAAGTATAGYAAMVRPANLVVLVAWCAACALAIATKPDWQGQRRGLASTFVLCSALVDQI